MGTVGESLGEFEKEYERWFKGKFDSATLPTWTSIEGNIYWVRYTYRFVLRLLELFEQKFGRTTIRVLDLGSGKGFLSFLLSRVPNIIVHSANVSRNMYFDSFLQENSMPEVHYSLVAHNDLPYKDSSFDVVLLIEVIEHERQPGELIRGALKTLKRDGLLIVTTPPRIKFLFRKDPHFRIKYLYLLPLPVQNLFLEKVLRLSRQREYQDYKVHNIFSSILGVRQVCAKTGYTTRIETEPARGRLFWKMIKIEKM